jgi:hypothetical protein
MAGVGGPRHLFVLGRGQYPFGRVLHPSCGVGETDHILKSLNQY